MQRLALIEKVDAIARLHEFLQQALADEAIAGLDELGGPEAPLVVAAAKNGCSGVALLGQSKTTAHGARRCDRRSDSPLTPARSSG